MAQANWPLEARFVWLLVGRLCCARRAHSFWTESLKHHGLPLNLKEIIRAHRSLRSTTTTPRTCRALPGSTTSLHASTTLLDDNKIEAVKKSDRSVTREDNQNQVGDKSRETPAGNWDTRKQSTRRHHTAAAAAATADLISRTAAGENTNTVLRTVGGGGIKTLGVMHDIEVIDVCAPWTQGARSSTSSADSSKQQMETNPAVAPATWSDKKEHLDIAMDMDMGCFGDEDIVNNVDGFLDEFLALAGSDAAAVDIGAVDMNMDVADEDLAWLDNPDAFLPVATRTPSSASSGADSDVVEEMASPAVVAQAPAVGCDGVAVGAVGVSTMAACVEKAKAIRDGVDVIPGGGATGGGDDDVVAVPGPSAIVSAAGVGVGVTDSGDGDDDRKSSVSVSEKEKIRREKVVRYLAKKKRRRWSRASSYQSRQRVANSRPRHKGRFLPLEAEFVPIAELQRRQRALMKQMQQQQGQQQEPAVEAFPASGVAGILPADGLGAGGGGAGPGSLLVLGGEVAI